MSATANGEVIPFRERQTPARKFRTSATLTKFLPALVAAKKAMGPLTKNKTNPHFRNGYADLAEVLDVGEGPLLDQGLVLMNTTGWAEDGWVVTTTIWHVSGEYIEFEFPILSAKMDPQTFGAGVTYARRFSDTAALSLAAEDDDGNTANGRPSPKGNAPGPLERAFRGAMQDATGLPDGDRAVEAGVQRQAETGATQAQIRMFHSVRDKLKWEPELAKKWMADLWLSARGELREMRREGDDWRRYGVTSTSDASKGEMEQLIDLLQGKFNTASTPLHDMERRR